jgi:hypothetical protein
MGSNDLIHKSNHMSSLDFSVLGPRGFGFELAWVFPWKQTSNVGINQDHLRACLRESLIFSRSNTCNCSP